MRTLNYLSDLRESRFGQPPPRHGLNLLWWFVHECVQIDSNGRIIALYNPANGDFGFCPFHNREGLLPYSNLPYYEVGNLNKTGSLPGYVTEKYSRWSNDSNKDRIIVSFNSGWNRFDSMYVTQHSGVLSFDQNHTYNISIDLLMKIKSLNHAEFLRQTNDPNHMYIYQQSNIHSQFTASHLQGQRSHQITQDDCTSCCALVFVLLFLFIILACLFYLRGGKLFD